MVATVETRRLAKRFKQVKRSLEQAELRAETFRAAHGAELGEVATRADLAPLREELGARIDAPESKLERRIDELEA
jgi:hypothetical protein